MLPYTAIPEIRLFVYGTLRPGHGHPMSAWLLGRARHLGGAAMRGRLYDLGPYGGAVYADDASPPDDVVRGDVLELSAGDAEAVLARLDEYEGSDFPRREVVVEMDSGGEVRCQAYLYAGDTEGRARVASGVWPLG